MYEHELEKDSLVEMVTDFSHLVEGADSYRIYMTSDSWVPSIEYLFHILQPSPTYHSLCHSKYFDHVIVVSTHNSSLRYVDLSLRNLRVGFCNHIFDSSSGSWESSS